MENMTQTSTIPAPLHAKLVWRHFVVSECASITISSIELLYAKRSRESSFSFPEVNTERNAIWLPNLVFNGGSVATQPATEVCPGSVRNETGCANQGHRYFFDRREGGIRGRRLVGCSLFGRSVLGCSEADFFI